MELVELAGRGKRIYDPLYPSMQAMIDDLFDAIKNELDKKPYAIYGHSMGGIIAYELALKIKENGLKPPVHIFFSGRSAPHVPYEDDEEMFYTLPDPEFKDKIVELGGTPKEFFDHPELMEILLPMIKNDFKLAETYEYTGEIVPLDYNISVFIGKDEKVKAPNMHGWKDVTNHRCSIYYFNGGHFFIQDQTEEMVKIMNTTLIPYMSTHPEVQSHPSKTEQPEQNGKTDKIDETPR